jgi:hypothetical protein
MQKNESKETPNAATPLKKGTQLPLRASIKRMHRRYGKALEKLAK